MRRNTSILVAILLCVIFCLPITTYAATYPLGGTDMSIFVDDTVWYVFTRDNIKDNAELDELGLTYQTIYDILYDNEAYMDAILFYEDGGFVELFVRKKALDTGVANLSNYSNSEVLDLAKELAKKYDADQYSVHESSYKFAKLEYFDPNCNYYICEYVTIVNKDNYTLTFQSVSPYTQAEYEQIQEIVDSVKFDVDPSIKEKKTTSTADTVIYKAIGGAVSGAVGGAVIALINQKKKKRRDSDSNPDSAADNIPFN